ncbi:MAG TPA: HEAT repeat domain-containing protein [Ktedonobacteraceae bacterium]
MHKEVIQIQRKAYFAALYEQWQFLDFRGVMHRRMNQVINFPLEQVFVFPDLLAGSSPAPNETFQSQSAQFQDMLDFSPEEEVEVAASGAAPAYQQALSNARIRQNVLDVLAAHRHLIILGDPGTGKTTLLRYILLQLTREDAGTLRRIPEIKAFVPLYIPLTAYAAAYRVQDAKTFTFDDFLGIYLRHTYLDQYTEFILYHLYNGQLVLLLDGLDEVDKEIQEHIVAELQRLASAYRGNYLLITSRLAGYQTITSASAWDDVLARNYQEYTLAYFSPLQVERFIACWYKVCRPFYELDKDPKWDKEQEEKLFSSFQLNDGVRGLAVHPLFLTILTLIQIQGATLPSHRVELFNLSVTTLMDSWLTTKGYAELSRPGKKYLNHLLSSLAFEMCLEKHDDLSRELLLQKVEHYLRENERALKYAFDKQPDAPGILKTISGQTGLLLERAKGQYEFLHRTFGEYLAANQLVTRKDCKSLIKQHVHQPEWREVILLALGVKGVLQNDEASVTSLIQESILHANSPHERWLHRDLLFASRCLADEVGMAEYTKRHILSQFFELYFTTPYVSLRKLCLDIFSTWKGSYIAKEAESVLADLVKTLIEPNTMPELVGSLTTQPFFVQKVLAYYRQLNQEYQGARINLLQLQITTVLQAWAEKGQDNLDYVFSLLADPTPLIRQIAASSLASLSVENPALLSALYALLSDPHAEVRHAGVQALNKLKVQASTAQDVLCFALSDPAAEVRQEAAEALGQRETFSLGVVDNLLQALYDPFTAVQQKAAAALATLFALDKQGEQSQFIRRELFAIIAQNDLPTSVYEAAMAALSEIGPGTPAEIETILAVLQDARAAAGLRQAAALALCRQAVGQESRVLKDLENLLTQPSLSFDVRREIALALGCCGTKSKRLRNRLLKLLVSASSGDEVRCAAVVALSQMHPASEQVIHTICSVLVDAPIPLQLEVINALDQLGVCTTEVWNALASHLSSADRFVREASVTASGHLCRNYAQFEAEPTQKILVDMALLDENIQVRRAAIAALGMLDQDYTNLLPYLSDILIIEPDAGIRAQVAAILSKIGAQRTEIISLLLRCLERESDPLVCTALMRGLGHVHIKQEDVFNCLLTILANLHASLVLRTEAVSALTELCTHSIQIRQQLWELVEDTTGQGKRMKVFLPQQTTDGYTETLLKHALARNIEILGQIGGKQPDTLPLLLDILRSNEREVYQDSEIKKVTLRALHEIDTADPALCETLLGFLVTQGVPADVQREAMATLGGLGKLYPAVRQTMIEALLDANSVDKRSLIQALGVSASAEPQEAITALLNFLRLPETINAQAVANAADREAALTVLGKLAYQNRAVVDVLLPLLRPASAVELSIRLAVARTLGQIGVGMEDVLGALLSVLGYPDPATQDPSPAVKQEAVRSLAQLGYERFAVLLQLYRALLSDKQVRPAILAVLARLQGANQEVVMALVEALSGSDIMLKIDVARALSQGEHALDPRVVRALCDNLNAQSPTLRKKVATALGVPGRQDSAVCLQLVEILKNDQDASVRKEVAATLGKIIETAQPQIEGDSMRRALSDALTDRDSLVRREAAFALLSDKRSEHVADLVVLNTMFGYLFAPTAPVRLKAVSALGQARNNRPYMVRALLRALSDEDHRVRKGAMLALSKIQTPELYIDELLVQHLQRYEPIASRQMSTADEDTIDITWLALQQVVEKRAD